MSKSFHQLAEATSTPESQRVAAERTIELLCAEIERLRAERRWVSVTERLPGRGDRVLVAHRRYAWSNSSHKYRKLKRLGVVPATYWLKGHAGLHFCRSDGGVVQEPVAWMPLPEPPEVQR